MAKGVPNEELGRRIAAARGYSRMAKGRFAEQMGTSRQTLLLWEKGKLPQREWARDHILDDIASLTSLPREFFEIDFRELPAMSRLYRLDQVARDEAAPLGVEEEAEQTLEADREARTASGRQTTSGS